MLAAAVRDGDEVTKQHILQRVNPSLKVYMLDIERRIMLCEEAELDLLALRPEDRPELPYRPACFRMIDALSEEDARDLTRLSKRSCSYTFVSAILSLASGGWAAPAV